MTKTQIRNMKRTDLNDLAMNQFKRLEKAREIYASSRKVLDDMDKILNTGDQSKIGPKYIRVKRAFQAVRSFIPSVKFNRMPAPAKK